MTLKIVKTGKQLKNKSLKNVEAIYNEMKFLQKKDREHFYVLHLNVKLNLIGKELISIGSLTAASVHPREVFKGAILSNSACIICVHNHPSGDPSPSKDDLEITDRLKKAGEIIGIPVYDHIIIGTSSYISIMEQSHKNKPSQSESNKPENSISLKEYSTDAIFDIENDINNANFMLKSIASLLKIANSGQENDDSEDLYYGLSIIIETYLEKVDSIINEHKKRFQNTTSWLLSHAELGITMTSTGAFSTAEKAREELNESIADLDRVISNNDIFKDRARTLKDKATTLLSSF